MKFQFAFAALAAFLTTINVWAQTDVNTSIQSYLDEHYQDLGLTQSDVSNWIITDDIPSRKGGARHVHIAQNINSITVKNGVANFALSNENKVVHVGNRLIDNLQSRVVGSQPSITPLEAVEFASSAVKMTGEVGPLQEKLDNQTFVYEKGSLAREKVKVTLQYWFVKEEVRLVWTVSLYQKDGKHWWQSFIDATTGEEIDRIDWVVNCDFPDHYLGRDHQCGAPHDFESTSSLTAPTPLGGPGTYNVFAIPTESPIHGNRSLEIGPENPVASPFGWHDTNGSIGEEYTITRGNNVYAYEDQNDTDNPGFSPDGGGALVFDFPYNGNNNPSSYESAAITNLFYMNNIMHDVWYLYGFDEASGNFQFNNYGNGGAGSDEVMAEAQDGGGTNNANFATPDDGANPRMQMYLWSTNSSAANYLNVNSPVSIDGPYSSTGATYGPGLPVTPITEDVVLVEDNTAPTNDGCETLTNAGQLNGKIALIDRGECNFTVKVESAQNAGALAVIIVNNVGGAPIQMGGTNANITIPSIMISQADGNAIKNALLSGTVNATISDGGQGSNLKDGDLDNGIIAHEYGHGISNRLTGGPSNSGCLSNAEQMGEGWSDWFGLMLTIENGDASTDPRGVGTYSTGQSTTGTGIRPAPYSTDFGVNPYTYDDSNDANNISQPHGVGFIFATALWDMTWALIDYYGGTPDPDVENGTGGNNVAMNLVIEGLKLQPCGPGMIDGRDAILEADQLLYGGQHQCVIWEAFANRGFGASASQGSSNSRSDQTEAFDLPTACQTPTVAPSAAFTASSNLSCNATILFEDNSTNIPQSWSWDFGDGGTSGQPNPTHTYAASGTYTVELTATNSIGSDVTSQVVVIDLPDSPVVSDVSICEGEDAQLSATSNGISRWRDASNQVIQEGNPLTVSNVVSVQTFSVENIETTTLGNVGPANANIGTGGYHNSAYHGAHNFTASQGFEIVSAWVDAQTAGTRTFYLASGTNSDGVPPSQPIDQVTVDIPAGTGRIDLNLIVPSAGNYNVGTNDNVDLFRNDGGANYPYTLAGVMTINSSSANTSPTGYYYYLYDIEVREIPCVSTPVNVTVSPVTANFSYTDNNGTVTFIDLSSNATSWFWDFGDGSTSTAQNPTHVYAQSNNYTVTLVVNGQTSCSATESVSAVVGIDELSGSEIGMLLTPNPTKGNTTLQLSGNLSDDSDILIYAADGRLVEELRLLAGTQTMEVATSRFSQGLYWVVLKPDNGTVVWEKLMITK